jgi:hypothetical protein
MVCNLERPEPQELFDRLAQKFSVTVLGGAEIIPESNEWYAVAVNYAMAEEFTAISEQAWKERDPRQACCENVVEMAARDGVFLRPPTYAQGFVKLTGTVGAELPAPIEIDVGSLTFITASTGSQPTQIGEDGTAVIRVRALVAGSSGNAVAETGRLKTPIAGVSNTVTVCGGTFCEGADVESCEALRARYLRRLQYTPRATDQWIRDKLTEWPCATRAITRAGSCCRCGGCSDCSCQDCGGQLGFYLMFDNSFPCGVAPASVIAEVEEWLFGNPQGYGLGQVPVGICGRVVPVKPFDVDVMIDLGGCQTSNQITQIKQQIQEFFTTIEPSQPIKNRVIETLVANIVGAGADFSVRLSVVNPALVYGDFDGPRQAGALVYRNLCGIEPDCDAMPCLRNVVITRPTVDLGGCS